VLARSQWLSPNATTRGEQFAKYFNPAAFALAPIGTFGDSGRNDAQMPGGYNDDLSIIKNFPIKESATIRFSANAYNAFNHVRLGNCHANWGCGIDAGFADAGFGAFWAVQSGRTIQFALSIIY